MGTKYGTILVGGVVQTYADDSPSDDGSSTEANRVKYVTVTGDLTAPLHSAVTRMDAALLAQVDEGPTPKAGNFTTTAAEHNQVIECTGTITISLLNPSGVAGYQTTVKNAGSGTVEVDVDGGANVDGDTEVSLGAGEARKFYVNAAGTAYYSTASTFFPEATAMLFYQDVAPPGWTITAAVDEHAVTLTKGSGAGGETGGTIGGTNDFSTQFASLAESATPGVGDHELSIAEMPAHTHSATMRTAPGVSDVPMSSNAASGSQTLTVGSTGGGGTHSHTVDLRVKWAACIVATKD